LAHPSYVLRFEALAHLSRTQVVQDYAVLKPGILDDQPANPVYAVGVVVRPTLVAVEIDLPDHARRGRDLADSGINLFGDGRGIAWSGSFM
jgi:hypothetical protein